jgi:hypothetical protein
MKTIRLTIGILLLIVAANAFGGGYYGLAGAENVPLEWLEGSPFSSYFLPSLFLLVVIGGTCLLSGIAVLRQSGSSRLFTFICSALLLGWITIQLLIIGYVSWMQPAILTIALTVGVMAIKLPQKQRARA